MTSLDASGVAIDVAEIGRRGPAAGARDSDDARRSITFRPSELVPWRVRVDFLVYIDEECLVNMDEECLDAKRPVEYEYVAVGAELALPISIASAHSNYDAIRRGYPRVLAKFRQRVEIYQRHGELLLRHQHGELAEVRAALRIGKAHKYHPLLVADYRARKESPTRIEDMAVAFRVHRATIYRELRASLAEGLMSEDELERRPPASREYGREH